MLGQEERVFSRVSEVLDDLVHSTETSDERPLSVTCKYFSIGNTCIPIEQPSQLQKWRQVVKFTPPTTALSAKHDFMKNDSFGNCSSPTLCIFVETAATSEDIGLFETVASKWITHPTFGSSLYLRDSARRCNQSSSAWSCVLRLPLGTRPAFNDAGATRFHMVPELEPLGTLPP
ncbi:hypothetical protein BT96DRAFT_985788 [Gymnopus androsaceus JB14]|uniref:Uncharacterized protein n=1 Tax=Gymnopus androsaceus JB14 TaxID=1447944 RepID=A0A6A4ICZ8_9AGAR|nr:hypothetical protein BT96DRAFT_985788 [Gymnopus androsaceus JB14]